MMKRRLSPCNLWLLAAFVSVLLAGCGKTEQEYLSNASQLQAKGDYAAAIIEVKNALTRNPQNAQARLLLGSLHNEIGDWPAAQAELRQAAKLGLIEGGRVTAQLALAMIGLGEAKNVLSEIKPQDSYESEPMTVVHAMRGRAHLLLRDRDNARKSLEAAAALDPIHPEVALLRAGLLLSARQQPQALEAIDAALKPRPGHISLLTMRADLLVMLDRREDALKVYDAILAARPAQTTVRSARALLLLNLGRFDASRKDIDILRKQATQVPTGHYLHALLLFRENKLNDAESAVQDALRRNPDFPHALLLAGAISLARGAHASAEALLAKVLAQFPGHIVARKLLASSQIKQSKHQEAFATVEPMLGGDNRDEVILGLAGDALMGAGNLDRAAQFYSRAVAANPQSANARTAAAVLKLRRGETDLALEELEAASQLDPTGSRADYILITTLYRRQDFERALAEIRKLEAKQPKSGIPHNLAGAVHMARKDMASARKAFERAIELEPNATNPIINLAQIDIAEQRVGDAEKRFEKVLSKQPGNLTSLLALSELALRKNDAAAVLKWLEQARAAHPAAIEPLGRLSSLFLTRGDKNKALEYAQEALSRNPGNSKALDILGTAQLAAGNLNAAVQTYNQLAQLHPAQPLAHYRLAAAHQESGNTKSAVAALNTALKLDPKYLEARVALARLQIAQGDNAAAIKSAQAVRELSPKTAEGWVLEGEALFSARRYAEAVKAYDNALAVENEGAYAVKAYIARARTGNRASAVAFLEKWVNANRNDQTARVALADAHLADGRFKESAAQYEQLVSGAPKNALFLNNLAMSYLGLKDSKAEETARRAFDLANKDPNVADTYGWILVESGKLKEGIELLEKTFQQHPKHAEVAFHLALALSRSGEKARARKLLEELQSIRNSPFAERARLALGSL